MARGDQRPPRGIHHLGRLLANQAKLAANHTAPGAWPPREGVALCQRIVGCGSCGKPMMTNFHTGQRPSYECGSRRDQLTTPTSGPSSGPRSTPRSRPRCWTRSPRAVALARSAADETLAGTSDRPGHDTRSRTRPLRRHQAEGASTGRTGKPARRPLLRHARKPNSPSWPRPSSPGSCPGALPRCPARPTSRNSPRTCRSGTPAPPPPGPQAAAAHPDRRRQPAAQPDHAEHGSGSVRTPAPPTNSLLTVPSIPARADAPRTPRSSSSGGRTGHQ